MLKIFAYRHNFVKDGVYCFQMLYPSFCPSIFPFVYSSTTFCLIEYLEKALVSAINMIVDVYKSKRTHKGN